MPLPECRIARFNRIKVLWDNPQMVPVIGYSPIDKQHYEGYYTRITTKIVAFTALQYINYLNNKHLKHT